MRFGRDYWLFWTGQVISQFGTSFTLFAIPLIVFQVTGSALNLAITSAAGSLPFLLFGLPIGAIADRVDRKKLMIVSSFGSALIVASIPLLSVVSNVAVWWIYVVTFTNSAFGLAFATSQYASVPALVPPDLLVAANGRLEGGRQAATVAGPLLAGALIAVVPTEILLIGDSISYIIVIATLLGIAVEFQLPSTDRSATTLRADMIEGLRYVLHHPLLRSISIMMALNALGMSTTLAQIVLFAKEKLAATNTEVAALFSAGGAGVVLATWLAGPIRRHLSYAPTVLGALFLAGVALVLFSMSRSLLLALPLWAVVSGLPLLIHVNNMALRQEIVPNELLGRVVSVAGLLAWSAAPLGSLAGGWAIEETGNVALVYAAIGIGTALISVAFAFGPVVNARDYIPRRQPASTADAISE